MTEPRKTESGAIAIAIEGAVGGEYKMAEINRHFWIDRLVALEITRRVMVALARRPTPDAGAMPEQRVSNEYADMATTGIEWLRNIRDGISTPDEALANMEGNLKRIRAYVARKECEPSDGMVERKPLDKPEGFCWYGIERCTLPHCDCSELSEAADAKRP